MNKGVANQCSSLILCSLVSKSDVVILSVGVTKALNPDLQLILVISLHAYEMNGPGRLGGLVAMIKATCDRKPRPSALTISEIMKMQKKNALGCI